MEPSSTELRAEVPKEPLPRVTFPSEPHDSDKDIDELINKELKSFEIPTKDPWIQYSVEFRDLEKGITSRQVVTHEEFGTYGLGDESRSDKAVFEIVSVYQKFANPLRPPPGPLSPADSGKTEKIDLQQIHGLSPTFYMRVHSISIIHALRSVVRYYPGQDLGGNSVDINWPYPILVHHYDELREFQKAVAMKRVEDTCVREKEAGNHLELLLGYLDKEVMESVRAEIERNRNGHHTFDFLWVSLKPGRFQLWQADSREDEEGTTGVVYSVQGGSFTSPRSNWVVKYWSMNYNGMVLGRVISSREIMKFDGVEQIPLICEKDDFDTFMSHDEKAARSVKKGKIYWDLNVPRCMYHEGLGKGTLKNQIKGMVMVDQNQFCMEKRRTFAIELKGQSSVSDLIRPLFGDQPPRPNPDVPELMLNNDQRDFMSNCLCHTCKRDSDSFSDTASSSLFAHCNNIQHDSRPQLTNQEYFLCPKVLDVFVFKTRTWEKVDVENLSPPRFEKQMIDHLVMDEGRLQIIKSLVGNFVRRNHSGNVIPGNSWTADYVDGKGNGLIFLLHGGPGVGKTFTAECIANLLERPLMVLTTTDIGTKPDEIEENLARNFKMAKAWKAVALIDEADVFVANRSIDNLERSSLVASFLRALEFYDGVLFLTTNRVGTFDDAILSRVHIPMHYPALDRGQRLKLWNKLITKLEKQRPNMRVKYVVKEYLESEKVSNYNMNGREIRNAFQTAVGTAEYNGEMENGKILLTEKNLEEIIQPLQGFKQYLVDLNGYRAKERGERLE